MREHDEVKSVTKKVKVHDVTPVPERAVAISAITKKQDRDVAMEHLNELELLAETAGAEVILKMVQQRDRKDGATAIGKGKVEELKQMIEEEDIRLILFDDDLTPIQVRNLEKELEVKVMDRSGLILDIFATRARTNEAKTQVELAQLQYLMPRLTRMWTHLSKQYGGIGTKGPGETQIETDRRLIKIRIAKLKEKLEIIDTQQRQQSRGRNAYPRFALVGYTNAGKSTLLKALTSADAYIEDKLFATLDTTVRAFALPGGQKALLSDTVGFIRKLPHQLVASFRSTLKETTEADVLLHVVDCTHPQFREQMAVVNETLASLLPEEKPTILLFNKVDKLEENELIGVLRDEYPRSVFVSAERNINIQQLLQLCKEVYEQRAKRFVVELPYTSMSKLTNLYEISDVISRQDLDEGIRLEVVVPAEKENLLRRHFTGMMTQKEFPDLDVEEANLLAEH